jgi:predicted acyl esterase
VREHDVEVRMRDGVVLRVNVYRPRGDGPFPVLLSVHPYGKDGVPKKKRRGWKLSFQFRIMNQAEPYQISNLTGWEAPDPAWWVSHGYVVINADERGAGTSDGTGSLLTDAEAKDSYDLIEWAAAQPWSNGNVGMFGVSYLALSQYKAAASHPPSLKAICPWEGFTDIYRDFMTPGGIPETGFSRIWQTATKRAARLSDDFRLERRVHPLRDAWWESLTPRLKDITVPMLVCTSFSDTNVHTVGSFRAFQKVSSADRFAYMHRGPKWSTFYSDEAKAAQLAFFERYLRETTDAAQLPRVRLEVRETHDRIVEVRDENEWPLQRAQWTPLYLATDGRLVDAAPDAAGTAGATDAAGAAGTAGAAGAAGTTAAASIPDAAGASGAAGATDAAGTASFDLRRNAAAFTYTFAHDTEITGPMNLTLWVSVAADGGRPIPFRANDGAAAPSSARKTIGGERTGDANLFVGVEKLHDGAVVPFEGAYGYGLDRVATGRLRMSLRELDAAASAPHQPEHTFRTPQPVAPNEVARLDIPLSPSATLFRAGDSLRLLVAGRYLEPRNPLFGHFPARYVASSPGRCTLHWDADRPARLEVPVIPRDKEKTP